MAHEKMTQEDIVDDLIDIIQDLSDIYQYLKERGNDPLKDTIARVSKELEYVVKVLDK